MTLPDKIKSKEYSSYFEKEKQGNKGVTIQIVGVGQPVIQEDEDPIDAEFEEVDG